MGLDLSLFPFLFPFFVFETKVVDSIIHVVFNLLYLFNNVDIHLSVQAESFILFNGCLLFHSMHIS